MQVESKTTLFYFLNCDITEKHLFGFSWFFFVIEASVLPEFSIRALHQKPLRDEFPRSSVTKRCHQATMPRLQDHAIGLTPMAIQFNSSILKYRIFNNLPQRCSLEPKLIKIEN